MYNQLRDGLHFSILMRLDKRLAAVTALGIDGEKLMDLNRSGIDWHPDSHLPEEQQAGERIYARNDIDRGHLVRRAPAVWVTPQLKPPKQTRTPFTKQTLPHRQRSVTKASSKR